MNCETRTDAYLHLKNSIIYRATHMKSGEVFDFADFSMFCAGNKIGAAIPTGETCFNIHNVNPGKSYTLDGTSALPGMTGNFLTLTVDTTLTDINDPVKQEDLANRILSFVTTENGTRELLLSDPWEWAARVIEMSGDTAADLRPYPYVAELYLVNKLREAGLMTDVATQYRGPDSGVHDFELSTMSLECKSRLHGDVETKAAELVISSEHQLSRTGSKPLYVVYFPMEDTGDLSLESCVAAFGEPRAEIMEKLAKTKFSEGDFPWFHKYHILGQPLVFEITDDFPRITPGQFVGGHFPSGITKLVYHVSLYNRPSCSLDDFVNAIKNGTPPVFTV